LKIAHVLFIDIVGYSKLSIDEQAAALERLNQVVQSTETFRKAKAARRLMKIPTGDGMALVFSDSPEAPVECAFEISRALAGANLPLRMGINSGPVSGVVDVNGRANVAGEGMNVAQRVMDCADAGHILLSKRVADDLAQFKHWRPHLHDLGACEVKHGKRVSLVNLFTSELGNSDRPAKLDCAPPVTATPGSEIAIDRRRRLWWWLAATAVLLIAGITAAFFFSRARGRPNVHLALASIPEKSVAVLPFENLSRDPDNAYLADGIQEEILTRLANVSELKVISRTSAAKFASSPDNLREIAGKLGVANILEGSVQKSADQVRVNVQLINATSDAHLWADTYDRKLTDVFAIETEIAQAVADKLKAKLTGREQHAISSRPTESSEAHQLYLKGRYFWNKRTSDGLKTGIGYFNQAIEKDPGYGPAYAGLADAYALLPNYSETPGQDAYPKAEAAALKALELNNDLAEAHISLANVRLMYRWGNGAESEFKKGLELNSNYSTGHHWYSIYLAVTGRVGDAITEMERAKELDPFSIIINTELGLPYLYSKQYDRAIVYFGKALEMDADFAFAHFALAEAYDRTGRYKEALAEHEKAVALAQEQHAVALHGADAPEAWYAMTGLLQNTYRALYGPGYWPQRLEAAKKLHAEHAAPATTVAGIYAILGDKEQAFAWLEKAYQESDDFLVFVNIQPQFENLHSDPRFAALLRKIGFTEPSR
ncbi:MAG: tetratricopeptide repeat protein, partial [Bradyrhizobium sp.]